MDIVFQIALRTWVVLIAIVLLLALYRLLVSRGEYTVLHVRRSELSLIPEQVRQDHLLTRIDYWGQLLTMAALIFGVAIAGIYMYQAVSPAAR